MGARFIISGVCAFTLCASVFAQDSTISSADPARMGEVAQLIILRAEGNMIGARGAAQVSQVADQAQLSLALIKIRQNDEVIRLLRKIAKE
jgi:hypothetical protein